MLVVLTVTFTLPLLIPSPGLVAVGQGQGRQFTGRAAATVDELAEPGKSYGLSTVIESHAELTIDFEGVVRGTVRSVWDFQRSGLGCARRETRTITLYGRLRGGSGSDGYIIGDPVKSIREYKTSNLDSADKRRECREESYPPHSEPTNWWGKFDNATTLSIYLTQYSGIQGFAARLTAGGETKRRIETFTICDGKPKMLPRVTVHIDQKGLPIKMLVTGADGTASGYFSDDRYLVYADADEPLLEMAHLEQGAATSPISPGGFLKENTEGEAYKIEYSGWLTIPNWESPVLRIYMKNRVMTGDDCDSKPKKPAPPIVLGDPTKTIKLTNVKGMVHYFSEPPGADWYPVTEGMQLPARTQIATGPGDSVTVETPDGARVGIKEMTMLTTSQLLTPKGRATYNFEVRMGEIEAKIPRQQVIRSDFSVQTPTATASVRGTTFSVRYDRKTRTTTVKVVEGDVLVTPNTASLAAITLNASQQVEITTANVGPIRASSTSAGTTSSATNPAVTSATKPGAGGGDYKWVSSGLGDCGGNDIGEKVGVTLPEASTCNANSAGNIAVCWDGNVHKNLSRNGPWCTYKSKAASPCRGGGNPGLAYVCQVSYAKLPSDDIVVPSGAAKPATWATKANEFGGQSGERFTLACPSGGELSDRVWGTDNYTNDSSICTAAVHAGLINPRSGGTVAIELRPGASSYPGSARNGVASKDYGSWGGSFVFVGPTGPRASSFPKDEYVLPGFVGTWDGGSAWGDLVLTQSGNTVRGTYSCCGGGTIHGTASGDVLRLTWTRSDGAGGEAFLTLKGDGTIEGKWCFGKGCDPGAGSPFNGRRR